ncbi:hypothetical protein ALC62_11977 [Cyphomyrmex costatus]|uniref:Reverse transcriptase/retrotransposon-derived protein RNase H-like domain-containing protein n=1 Tax=Cyphomyrmex costatus TaxID=456900 RepID=A0A151ICJ6_9HYME|nr:hypothetical protein ALC62_11977 [Cyphomyrmex costatus]
MSLIQEPVLILYRAEAETELHTDAAALGFGAILMQINAEDQRFYPVHYASWKTTDAETQITPGSKIGAKFLGPYEITKVLRGDRYGEHEGPRTTSTSADHIKRWLSPECMSDEFSDDDDAVDAALTTSEADI